MLVTPDPRGEPERHTATMTCTLFHVPKTISSPIVQILLELHLVGNNKNNNSSPCIKIQEMTFAELKTPSHLSINPMGTSPTFQDTDNGIVIWESGALLDYLLDMYDTQHTIHPAPLHILATGAMTITTNNDIGKQQRAKYLQLKQYIIATVYPTVARLYLQTLHKPQLSQQKQQDDHDTSMIRSLELQWIDLMGPTLTKWLGDGPYFLGGTCTQPTAVDFLAAKPLGNAHAMGLLKGFPTLQALLERITSRPTYKPAYGYEKLPLLADAVDDVIAGRSNSPRSSVCIGDAISKVVSHRECE